MITAEKVDRVVRFHGGGLPVVSVYLGVAADPAARAIRTHASSLLHEIRPLADDQSLEHEARMSLRGDISRIQERVGAGRVEPGALALFSCSGAGLFEEVQLPRAVRDRIFVDATPRVRPMLAVLDEYHRCCVVLLDKAFAQVWELHLGELRDVREVQDTALRKPDYGGWHGLSEHRVRNKADNLARRHYRRVATLLDELFRADRYELLAIGGHEHELPEFMEFLPHNLRSKVAGTFNIDPKTMTTAEVRQNAEAIVDRYEREEERRLVAEVLERAATGRPAAIGLERCLWAGSVAAVERLLVQDGAVAPGVVCDESGWLATSGETCVLCGRRTRRTPDVIDELVEAVIDGGGSVEHVRADTELKEHAVVAWLRFPLPPEPASQG